MFKGKTGIREVAIPAVTLVLLLVLWELADLVFDFNRLIMPSPSEIGDALFKYRERLLRETGITMLESVLGFFLGCGIAYILAICFVRSQTVKQAIYPYAIALKSTPLIAIAPLLVLWFGNGMFSKVVMSALVAFFPVLVNSVRGLTAIDAEALDLMRSLSASWWQILYKIRIPNSMGYLFSSLKIASSLAVVGAVIGEFTGASGGIGHLINTSSYNFNTPLMFAGIIMISVGGILFFGIVAFLEQKIVFWEERA